MGAFGRTLQRASGARRLDKRLRRSIGGGSGQRSPATGGRRAAGPGCALNCAARLRAGSRSGRRPSRSRPGLRRWCVRRIQRSAPDGHVGRVGSRAPSVDLRRSSAPTGPAGGSTSSRAAAPRRRSGRGPHHSDWHFRSRESPAPSVDLRRSPAPAGPVSARITPGGTTPAGTPRPGRHQQVPPRLTDAATPTGTTPTGTAPAGRHADRRHADRHARPGGSRRATPRAALLHRLRHPAPAPGISGPASASPIGPAPQPNAPVTTLPAADGSTTSLRRSSATADLPAVERETPVGRSGCATQTAGPVVLRSMAGPGARRRNRTLGRRADRICAGIELVAGWSAVAGCVAASAAGTETEPGNHAIARGIGGIAVGATGRTIAVRRSQFGLGPVIAGIPAVRGVAGSVDPSRIVGSCPDRCRPGSSCLGPGSDRTRWWAAPVGDQSEPE